MRRRSRSSASPAAVFARIRFSRRCATSASACSRSSGGVWPTSTRALFCRTSSCASSSERCCTVTLASVALSVQYACFTAAVVWTTDSRTRSSELSRLRLATMVCWRAEIHLAVLQQRLRERELEAGLQRGIEARQRIVATSGARCPTRRSSVPEPHGSALPHAGRREQIVRVDAALAEQEVRRRRRHCSTCRGSSRTPARRRFRSRDTRAASTCVPSRTLARSGLCSTARRTASSTVSCSVDRSASADCGCEPDAGRCQQQRPQAQRIQRAFHIPVSVTGVTDRRKRRLQVRRAMRARQEHVDRRHDEQREERSDDHAGDEHDADAVARAGARAGRKHEREMSDHGRRRRHQDRAQPRARGFDDRGELVSAGLLQVIGELHDEDAVLRHEPDQRDEPDLAVDVQARESEEREQQRPRDRERHRPREDDERIAEALELRREHEIDQDRRQQERAEEPAAFRPQLPRLSRVVDREPLWQGGARFVFEEAQRLIERNRRRDHTLYADRVELLEFLQLARLCGGLEGGEGRERHELIARAGDVDVGRAARATAAPRA